MQHPLEHTLDLSNKNIDDERLSEILGAIPDANTIAKIDLSFNQLTISGAIELVRFIKKHSHVDYVDLTSNKLNDEAIALFSELNIREIHFEGNHMTGITLNSFFNNTHVLLLTYQYERGNKACDAIAQELENHIQSNRLKFRAWMVFVFVAIAQARRQEDNLFYLLPFPIVAHILKYVAADFQYANTALSNPSLAVGPCIEYILDMVTKKQMALKRPSGSGDWFFFKRVSQLMPVGDKLIEKDNDQDRGAKCCVLF